MRTFIWSLWFAGGTAIVVTALSFVAFGLRVISEREAGLVVKRYGRPLPIGRVVALNGEAGLQANLLTPGWHFGYWHLLYKVQRVPMVIVPPGEIALVVAADGAPVPPNQILGREVSCNSFQDAEKFLHGGGQRGRQIAIITAGTYRINPALFQIVRRDNALEFGTSPDDLFVRQIPADQVGIVTVLDGRPSPAGDLAGPSVDGHDSFQNGQAFVDAGGSRGLQEDILLSGSWNINPWFVNIELTPMTEIPIGYVGVVVSYVGAEHLDVSGDAFTHGDLVARGHKGVWVDPLLPGKHPINAHVMKVELVPTTNIVLNWATRTEAHHYDERLAPITVRSKDGFAFSLDVSQIIHIGMKNAPRVISRVGSMQNLVDHVLQPTVANYFRNSAQRSTVLEFLSEHTERQREAFDNIKGAVEAYDVECLDTLIGDIVPPAELMKTQTDRKIADELQRTYEVQREAQVQRQALERETSIANLQNEVVRSEQQVRIAERQAMAVAETARGEASATKLRAEAEAASLTMRAQAEGGALRVRGEAEATANRLRGEAEATVTLAIGTAKAESHRLAVAAIGTAGYTTMQIAAVLAEHNMKLVPEISVTSHGHGNGASMGVADAFMAKLLSGTRPDAAA
ncbi:MAG: SPFH domain-containing protein [Vicinamibacteraceae bacterium]